MTFIPNWKKLHKFYSTWVAVFWMGLNMLYGTFWTLQELLPTWLFLTINFGMFGALLWARVTKQPGVSDDV